MSNIEGGLLDRLVFDSFVRMLRESLDALEWFDTGRWHDPFTLRTSPVPVKEEIPPNTIVVTFEDATDEPGEIGSTLSIDTTVVWIDIYPVGKKPDQSMSLGRHIAGDVRDILRGKMPSVNRTDPSFMVYDLTEAGVGDSDPDELFLVQIDNVEVLRDHNPPSSPGRFWFSVTADLVEERE